MSKKRKSPAEHGSGIGKGGIVPPIDYRWKPGQSGNPNGRPPAAGLSVREMINDLAAENLTEAQLRAITLDAKSSWTKRTAANRMLRTLECGDIADFSGLLRGENNLEDLRGMGINTAVVKKLKQKTRTVPNANGKTEEIIEREVELYDRAGVDFDRVCDRTEGKPAQAIEVTGADGGPIQSETAVKHSLDYGQLARDIEQFAIDRAAERISANGNGESVHSN